MDAKEVEAMFTRADGSYLFSRWRRPIVPVVFGVAEASLPAFKGAIEAVVALAGHRMAETDAEMGANLMIFAFRDWEELLGIPKLEGLVPELAALVPRLVAVGANQYRVFRVEADGAIRAAFVFLRMDAGLAEVSAEVLALSQAVQVMRQFADNLGGQFEQTLRRFLALQTLGTLLLLLLEIGNGFSTYLVLLSSGLVVFAALWYSYWRGWQPALAGDRGGDPGGAGLRAGAHAPAPPA